LRFKANLRNRGRQQKSKDQVHVSKKSSSTPIIVLFPFLVWETTSKFKKPSTGRTSRNTLSRKSTELANSPRPNRPRVCSFVTPNAYNRGYIVDNNASLIGSGLHQSLIGLLSNYKVARDLQDELETLIDAKNKLSLKDLIGLPILPAIVAESMRLTILKTPSDVCYRLSEDMWYRKWFLPKGSIVILDRDMIFPTVRLTDPQVSPSNDLNSFIVPSRTLFREISV